MLISYAVISRNSGGKTGLKMEQPIYRVGDGLQALPPGGHATIRSFVFGVGVGDPEAETLGTERICRKTATRSHKSMGGQISSVGSIKRILKSSGAWKSTES